MDSDYPNLTIFTTLSAREVRETGAFILPKKFISGVSEYALYWSGKITVLVSRAHQDDNNLDHIEVHPSDCSFDLQWIEEIGSEYYCAAIAKADLILAPLVPEFVFFSEVGINYKVPVIYIAENAVSTRCQMIRSETKNILLRLWREFWTKRLEKKYRVAVSMASGVQCNGIPTYNSYRTINDHTLLFFDTRVCANQIISKSSLKERLARLQTGEPLRLGFSGRFIAIKGVDHLPLVAHALRVLGVPFTMDICGGGDLESKISNDIESMGLADCVTLRGVLDFENELLPFISNEIDLFVCCHRQGDPSCTYLETFSCGVPMVGYYNESLAGLIDISGVGKESWLTPLNDPTFLAKKIAEINSNRDIIIEASYSAVAFASKHTFEQTMNLRIQHMANVLQIV